MSFNLGFYRKTDIYNWEDFPFFPCYVDTSSPTLILVFFNSLKDRAPKRPVGQGQGRAKAKGKKKFFIYIIYSYTSIDFQNDVNPPPLPIWGLAMQ